MPEPYAVLATGCDVLTVFSCDFDPQDLPAPPDPGLILPGQKYAPLSPQDVLPVAPTGDAQPEEIERTGDRRSGALVEKPQQAGTLRPEGRADGWGAAELDRTVIQAPASPPPTADSSSGAVDLFSIPSDAVGESAEQRLQQQLMLESLLWGNAEGSPSCRTGFLQQSQTAAGQNTPASGLHSVNSEPVEDTLGRAEQQQHSRQIPHTATTAVPPFILRKRGVTNTHRQTRGPAVSDEVVHSVGQPPRGEEAEPEIRRDGDACRRVKGELTAE
ncbi:uncharacterized protein EMH_0033130 [Eimeria mitis]|uniref:Uncharacterized protein n=1 Tax=Eimeria mitis TaxID=44415 RepID=U6JZK1_9EIME|nr:uncharacterized protein EMH_0033130 [Eimeria mitis]CDJ30900.1 hypothetical protein EMH_0033130 [Eimeria mitis]